MPPPDLEEYADCRKNEIRSTRSDDRGWADLSRLKAGEHVVRLVDVLVKELLLRVELGVPKVPNQQAVRTAYQRQKASVFLSSMCLQVRPVNDDRGTR